MKKSQFTETQIIAILKKTDAGMKEEALCRQHSISSAIYYSKAENRGLNMIFIDHEYHVDSSLLILNICLFAKKNIYALRELP